MIFRLRGERRGDHVHARLWAGESEGALGNCGALVFRIGEWQLFGAMLTAGARLIPPEHAVLDLRDPLGLPDAPADS
jgi:hypothetical protein